MVARESLASGERHIWWLWMDADEFPAGPDGTTVRDYLAGIDRRFRIVGSRTFNHFPDAKPEYLPGFHPLDLQPRCDEFVPGSPHYCAQPHWKHPLQRFDRAGPFLGADIGFHTANLLRYAPVYEPLGGIVTHHFQYRDEDDTRARMELLCGGESRNAYNHSVGNRSIARRFHTLDAVYERRWRDVDNLGGAPGPGVEPAPVGRTVYHPPLEHGRRARRGPGRVGAPPPRRRPRAARRIGGDGLIRRPGAGPRATGAETPARSR